MQIKELAQRVGVSPDTIRFYEKQGLLDPSLYTRQSNNYRSYKEAAVEHLLLIKQAKRYGFSLRELQKLNNDWQDKTMSAADKRTIMLEKIQQIDQQLGELEELKRYLSTKLDSLGHTEEAF
jgi:MerR family transcriptional regulator, Zn(II)-responsive regulator of zntA